MTLFSALGRAFWNFCTKVTERPEASLRTEKEVPQTFLCVQDITRRFPSTLDLGSGAGHIIKFADKDKIDTLVQMDMSGLWKWLLDLILRRVFSLSSLWDDREAAVQRQGSQV